MRSELKLFLLILVAVSVQACSGPGLQSHSPNSTSRGPASSDDRTCAQIGCDMGLCKFSIDANKVADACADASGGCMAAVCHEKSSCSFLSDFVHHAEACRKKHRRRDADSDE